MEFKKSKYLKIKAPKTTVEDIRLLLEKHDVGSQMAMRKAFEKDGYILRGKEYEPQSKDIHYLIFNCSTMACVGKIDFKKMVRKSTMTAKQIQHVIYAVFCHWNGGHNIEFENMLSVAVEIRELLNKNRDKA